GASCWSNGAGSTTITSSPPWAAARAKVTPAMPAPATMTSASKALIAPLWNAGPRPASGPDQGGAGTMAPAGGWRPTSREEDRRMLAMEYRGPRRVRVTDKPIPEIRHPQDAIVRVTRACVCGSDLHLYHGLVPDTRVGSTFGHE